MHRFPFPWWASGTRLTAKHELKLLGKATGYMLHLDLDEGFERDKEI